MGFGTKVVTKTGEHFEFDSDTFEFADRVLYVYDESENVLLAVPQENVEYCCPCEVDNKPRNNAVPPHISKSDTSTPDPGPGYRLIDPAVDTPQEGDEFWNIPDSKWQVRDPWNTEKPFMAPGNHYRRRVTPEPVCKREAFSGGGSPSPRECGVCGEGPCTKVDAETFPQWIIMADGRRFLDGGYIRRISKDRYVSVSGDGQESGHRWTTTEQHRLNEGGWIVATEAEALALLNKPQPAESPDDWVTQDRVPVRVGVDWFRYSDSEWRLVEARNNFDGKEIHGWIHPWETKPLQVRCRRKDLPPLPTEIHIGDAVVVTESPKREDSWDGCRRTVQAKVKNGYVVGKVGEPISRIYLERELRVIPKSDGE